MTTLTVVGEGRQLLLETEQRQVQSAEVESLRLDGRRVEDALDAALDAITVLEQQKKLLRTVALPKTHATILLLHLFK